MSRSSSRRAPAVPRFLRVVWRELRDELRNEEGVPVSFEEFYELSLQGDERIKRAVRERREKMSEEEWKNCIRPYQPYRLSQELVNRTILEKDSFSIKRDTGGWLSIREFLVIVLAGDPGELEQARRRSR